MRSIFKKRGVPQNGVARSLLTDPLTLIASIVLLLNLLSAIFAPYLGLPSPEDMDLSKEVLPPSVDHILGTDSYGRDMLSRVIYGGRVSLSVGFLAVLLAAGLGTPLGMIAGYYGNIIDTLIMRAMDAIMTFPPVLLALTLVGLMGPSVRNVTIGLGIVYMPRFARITRANTVSLKNREFVLAARAIGLSDLRIMLYHLLPNISGPIIVQATVAYAYSIIAEAGMSFLGLGTQPPTPSWGLILSDAKRYVMTAPWYSIPPGLALCISVLSITFIGDKLRQVLDPRQRDMHAV